MMRVLDLFSGVGMFAYGMEKAGHEVVAFCEIEEWPRRVLAKLTESDVAYIRATYPKKNGVQLARQFNVVPTTIYRILKNERWA